MTLPRCDSPMRAHTSGLRGAFFLPICALEILERCSAVSFFPRYLAPARGAYCAVDSAVYVRCFCPLDFLRIVFLESFRPNFFLLAAWYTFGDSAYTRKVARLWCSRADGAE